jgi:hypothetical protein
MARQIVDGKAPDVPIEATKIVGTLSRQALDTTFGSARSIAICSFGYVATMLHVVSRPSPASGRLARRHLPHRSPIRISSARGGNSLPGWD